MSQGVKDIKKKLDKIAYNSQQFGFKIDSEPIRKRRPETCSYVNQVEIIGRQHDLDHIVGTYLTSNDQRQLSFLTIVGIGGLGKTALAQLVYNDPRVTTAFPLRLWTCVADQDQQEFDVKAILVKILASATGNNPDHGSTMDQVQSQAQQQLAGKKFLLVLDDVWNESRDKCCDVARYLIRGAMGSWIVVTSRSQETAKIIGDGLTHNLEGLSRKDSWLLFERAAFTSDQLSNPSDELVEIGQKIVDRCAGVPLAIRVAGSLLYGQDKSKWQSVQKIGLANIRQSGNGIIPILKLSFHNLETPLKSCFSYCVLFPKDYVMDKETLISLWMAQGYIVPFDKGQSLLEAAEEYFSILLRRCFFQDIRKDAFGEIKSCKMHDLMHDLAQSVSGNEILCSNLKEFHVDQYEGVRIPWINHLPNLVSLHLTWCNNLEYTGSSSEAPLQLPYLSKLSIVGCRKLACTMMCPSLEDLQLRGFNEGMQIMVASTSLLSRSSNPQHSASSSSSNFSDILVPKLKSVEIDNDVAWLESLPMESLLCLETLDIKVDESDDMQHLPNCIQNLPALQTLQI